MEEQLEGMSLRICPLFRGPSPRFKLNKSTIVKAKDDNRPFSPITCHQREA